MNSPGPDGIIGQLYQTFNEETVPVFHKFFQKLRKGPLPNSFYEAKVRQ